jgi:hypothetical protein
MYELTKNQYKTIWLRTEDATTDSERIKFTFDKLPLIKIIGEKNILKINSITLSGDGLSSAPGHNWVIKLGNVKFNQTLYFNSDKDTTPTIAMINYDQNNSVQTGNLSFQIEKQDINQIILYITAHTGTADAHGAVKNSQNIEFHIGLVVCEYME